MYRLGLIGLGEIARSRHLSTIAADPDLELAGVADPHGDLTAFGVPAFRSHREMLAGVPALDAVAICTPPRARTRIALDAIAAGKHVLVEKPPTATVAESLRLREAADAAGVVLFTAWHSQHNEAVERARTFLAEQDVARVAMAWSENFEHYHSGQDWIWRPGGFGVFDAGINGFSILTRISPRLPIVSSCELLVRNGADTPIAARVRFGIGAPDDRGEAVLDWRVRGSAIREITVTTGRGTILQLMESGGKLFVDGAVVVQTERAEYPRLYARFASLLREGVSDVDLEPLILTNDALACGRRVSELPSRD